MNIAFSSVFGFLAVLGVVVLTVLLGVNIVKLVSWLVGRVFRFVGAVIKDAVHLVGHAFSALILLPLVALNFLSGNMSRVRHYGRAIFQELRDGLLCFYRIAIRHPLALIGLVHVVDGVERRVPEVVRQAPGTDLKGTDRGLFEGYRVVGSLPGGGSGAKLYIAVPGPDKARVLAGQGFPAVGKVVIKSFALQNGPSLPQIVRESRALESAKRLGLVLEHGIGEQYFFYVMPYVPGDNLSLVVERMHAASGGEGLPTPQLRRGVSFVSDLLLTLERYHQGGLWHKDVKPDNLVVCGERAYLVDLGLVTPLASAMTLTTHGTEYFRDPELVRLAMKGAKVNEVDGVRFDLYGVGAVLFSVIEGGFPAHGGLSRITKRCPEALHWIVRRSMAELNGRYSTAREMLLDLHTVLAAADPFALKPADLPSLGGAKPAHLPAEPPPLQEFRPDPAAAAAWAAHAAREASAPPPPVPQAAAPLPAEPPSRTGRRVMFGLAAAALLFLAVGSVGALWVKQAGVENRARSAQAYDRAMATAERAMATAEQVLADGVAVVELHSASVADQHQAPLRWRSTSSLSLSLDLPEDAAPRLLVLDDYSSLARPGSAAAVSHLLDDLARAGFLVWGDDAAELDEDGLELLAGARNTMGLLAPDQAMEALGRFLEKNGEFAGAVWLRPAASSDGADGAILNLGDAEQGRRIARALHMTR
jgi:serine/threonine protein kinase